MTADLFAVLDSGTVQAVPLYYGRGRVKATDRQISEAYASTKNIWDAGKQLGMSGQAVQERLIKMGVPRRNPRFTVADDARLLREYETHANAGTMGWLAKAMGRTPQFLARQAKRLGITDRARSRPYLSEFTSGRFKEWHLTHEHPRGMLGKRHSASTRKVLSQRLNERWEQMSESQRDKISQRLSDRYHALSPAEKIALIEKQQVSWKSGWREIGGKRNFYRSRWEANYARYLEWLRLRGVITSWEHEPETFWFEAIRRGTRSYLPDFRVVQDGCVTYHEVKGWMDDKSATKLKRMAKYHPHICMIVIRKKEYQDIGKVVAKMIPGWE